MADTDLILSGLGEVDFSARGLTERLEPIATGAVRRTVNGTLVDVTDPAFRKYALRLSATDQEPPALDGAWIGQQVVVDTVTRIAHLTSGSPDRTVVPGSSYVVGSFTVYRPRLTMLITGWSLERDEWGSLTSWSLDLEEV